MSVKRLLSISIVAALVSVPLTIATTIPVHAQNVFERAKKAAEDAAKKAREPQKPQPPVQTPPPKTTANPPAAGAASQPVTAGDLLSAPPAAPVVLDPKTLPDILGVHLGMSAADAQMALRAQYAGGTLRPFPYPLPPIKEPLVLGFGMNLDALGAQGNDKSDVDITPPPNAQVVWRVNRATNQMHVNRATLLGSLREKYGKESIALANGDVPARSDNDIVQLYFLIDEHGKHVPPPPNQQLARCVWTAPTGPIPDMDLFHGAQTNNTALQDPWVASSCIGTIVHIEPYQGRDPNIIEIMYATVVDYPLYLRSANATATWWKAANDKARQDDLDKSKQARPKL